MLKTMQADWLSRLMEWESGEQRQLTRVECGQFLPRNTTARLRHEYLDVPHAAIADSHGPTVSRETSGIVLR